jgi:hypothetical protein
MTKFDGSGIGVLDRAAERSPTTSIGRDGEIYANAEESLLPIRVGKTLWDQRVVTEPTFILLNPTDCRRPDRIVLVIPLQRLDSERLGVVEHLVQQ